MRALLSVALSVSLAGVSLAQDAGGPKPGPDGWIQLFNGKDLAGWQDGAGKPATRWKVEDGVIVWQKGCGDLWTVGRYGDFILDLEFNIAKGTNSGILLRCDKLRDWLNTSFEIQILDTVGENRVGKHDCGALYDVQAPAKQPLKPAGEWNRYVITFRGNRLEVVFNDVKTLDVDLDKWTEAGKNPDGTKNKFKIAYAKMAREGFIGLQDHGGAINFRNIKLKPLDTKGTTMPVGKQAAAPWQKLFENEEWYKGQAGKEETFTGTLEAVKGAGGPSILMRTSFYRLGERTIYTGARKVKVLDELVGKKVEIRGKAVDMELEGQNLKEIWPAAVRLAP